MLYLKDLPDLLKYLDVRREMAEGQYRAVEGSQRPEASRLMDAGFAQGMVFAFEEAKKAVQSLIRLNEGQSDPAPLVSTPGRAESISGQGTG